jgi:hypothetical protein
MKRCPQCLFIYPESDQRCDFDQTPLVAFNESEIEPASKPRGNRLKPVLITAAVVVLGFVAFLFFGLNRNRDNEEAPASTVPVAVAQPAAELPSPSPSPSVSPSPSPSPSPKPSPRIATSHTTSSVDPVSTSGPGIGTRRGSKPTILLTSGGKIDADQVWRTRDGVWYRKNGIVTLLKPGRVKAIVNH